MAEYQRKNGTVEANQFKSTSSMWPAGVVRLLATTEPVYEIQNQVDAWLRVKAGDWIVKDSKGHTYVFSDDVFQATYELVNGERDAENI